MLSKIDSGKNKNMTIKLTRTNKVLGCIALALSPIALVASLVYGYMSLVGFMTNVFYEAGSHEVSFLTYSVSHTKKLTTEPLHIEYSVLKVPGVKTTAVKN